MYLLMVLRFLVRGLTHQRVDVSLGVVEEAFLPTDQVKGVDQVRAAQVLFSRNRMGVRP